MAEKSKKATKAKKDNKNLIIGICAAVVAVVVIIIIAVTLGGKSNINDNYFVSDNTKYVYTEEADPDENDQYSPLKTHIVYTYDGDKITSVKTYFVYGDANSAKAAFDALKAELGDEASKMEINNKYIIVTSSEEEYKDLTASDVKAQIELLEKYKNMDSDELEDDSEVEIDETEEENED